MTRAELVRIVDIVQAAWPTSDSNRHAVVRTWWRYLQDLEYQHVLAEIDKRVVRGGWPPRVGEVRRAVVLDSELDTPQKAWTDVLERLRAVETGTEWNEISAETAEAMRLCGLDGRLRPDEKTFKGVYEEVCRSLEDALLVLRDPEPFGDVK